MNVSINNNIEFFNHKNLLIIGFFLDQDLTDEINDQILRDHITSIKNQNFDSQKVQSFFIMNYCNIMLVNCGSKSEFKKESLTKLLKTAADKSVSLNCDSIQIVFPLINNHEADWQLNQIALIFEQAYYQFNLFKTNLENQLKLKKIDIHLENVSSNALNEINATIQGIRFTKYLADLPANHCTPTILASHATKLSAEFSKIKTNIYNLDDIKKMKMGSFLAVAQGSIEEPKFIELIYTGSTKMPKPIVLVGKGITFDAGGISIKPAAGMEEMKYDMGGAAAVLGIFKTCALLDLPINLIGLIPATENLPSGSAIKPGDVVTSMSGITIEITNTDAEGRLVLADALTYAEKYNPQMVFDMATLTGAIIIALGSAMSGYMTTDENLAELIHHASDYSNDKAWRLPLTHEYQEAMDSPVADLLNSTGDRAAGSVTAAVFLSKFTKKYPWAHIDIAGTAWISGKKRVATGRPVPLMVQLILSWIKTNLQ